MVRPIFAIEHGVVNMQRLPFSTRIAKAVVVCAAGFGVVGPVYAADSPSSSPVIVESEVNDTAQLPPPGPHQLIVGGGFEPGGLRVIDGDHMRQLGAAYSQSGSNLVIDPNDKFFYFAETTFAHGNRGPRQDYISVYDNQLRLVTDFPIPGRLISIPKTQTFDVSADGRFGYVYNMQPAASVSVVDLVAHKLTTVVEIPGCGLVFPFGPTGFASLCADGSAAIATPSGKSGAYSVTRTQHFFDAEQDPVFEESLVDRQTGKALFITYSGRILPVTLGPTPVFGEPWSLQQAAGQPLPSMEPEQLAWRPGGLRFAALHKASGKLFVLMHPGAHWSHKDPGSQIWVFDIAAKKRIAHYELKGGASSIAVSQDPEPLLFVIGGPPGPGGGGLSVLDASTGVPRGTPLAGISGGILAVHGY